MDDDATTHQFPLPARHACTCAWWCAAFALDPDGYWIELVKRAPIFGDSPANEYNFSQTMLRVKDGPASAAFYQEHLGMTLLRNMNLGDFSLFFLATATEQELTAAFDAQTDEQKKECSTDGTVGATGSNPCAAPRTLC